MVDLVLTQFPSLNISYPPDCEANIDEFALDGQEFEVMSLPSSVRQLSSDDYLFREGDLKTHVYRLETGIICITAPCLNGPPEIIETVFPGNLLGLGFLKRNIYNAKAVVGCCVSVWPLSAIPALVAENATAQRRQAEATEREFAHRRSVSVVECFETVSGVI